LRQVPLDLVETLRSTGAAREFDPGAVPDDVVYRILDTARFAPNGGNRQAWRVVVVRDDETRRRLRDLYLPPWYEYLAMTVAGLTPWAPVTDRAAEARARTGAAALAEQAAGGPGGFAEHFDEVPVLLALLADLRRLAAVDRDLDRYTLVGGASVYPFAWSILLAARAEGLGGVMTTMVVAAEDEVRALLGVPDEFAVAAVLALGRPVHQPHRLRRLPVEDFATVDRFDGTPLGPGGARAAD
jgi:nitroreductase